MKYLVKAKYVVKAKYLQRRFKCHLSRAVLPLAQPWQMLWFKVISAIYFFALFVWQGMEDCRMRVQGFNTRSSKLWCWYAASSCWLGHRRKDMGVKGIPIAFYYTSKESKETQFILINPCLLFSFPSSPIYNSNVCMWPHAM